jgi:hypothetical protein
MLPANSVSPVEKAISFCRTIVQPDLRLGCYDDLDLQQLNNANTPRFAGKRSVKTELFTISEPTMIRYQSDGVIFVLAIHNRAGEVVQNLHIGGSGEDSYLLESPGTYFLRVNGSTTWRIWLETPVQSH